MDRLVLEVEIDAGRAREREDVEVSVSTPVGVGLDQSNRLVDPPPVNRHRRRLLYSWHAPTGPSCPPLASGPTAPTGRADRAAGRSTPRPRGVRRARRSTRCCGWSTA